MDEPEKVGDKTSDPAKTDGWPLLRVLDVVTVVLLIIVVMRAVGGLMAALGIPSPSISIPSIGSGVVGQLNLFSVSTHLRIQYGTEWADITSGLVLLVCVALLVLPRWIWGARPQDPGLSTGRVLVVATGAFAVITGAAALVGMINALSSTPGELAFTEAVTVATSVASATLAGLVAVLCWFGSRLVAASVGWPGG